MMRTHFMMYGYNPTYPVGYGAWVGADGTSVPTVPTYDGQGAEFGITTYDNWVLTRWPDQTDRSLEDFVEKFPDIHPLLASRYDDIVLRCEGLTKHVEERREKYQWILLEEIPELFGEPQMNFAPGANEFKVRMPWGYCGNHIFNRCRQGELSVLTAERVNAWAVLAGGESRQELLEESWKKLMVTQHHDIQICGLLDDERKFITRSLETSKAITEESLEYLSKQFATGDDRYVMVYNPLSYTVCQTVEYEVSYPRGKGGEGFSVWFGDKEVQCEYDVLDYKENRISRAQLRFAAKVPGQSIRCYRIAAVSGELSGETRLSAMANTVLDALPYTLELDEYGIRSLKKGNIYYFNSGRGVLFAGMIDGKQEISKGIWTVTGRGSRVVAEYMGAIGTVGIRFTMSFSGELMVDMLKSMDMQVSDCRFQQEQALCSVMPFLKLDSSLERKSQRKVLTSGAASTYMFTSFEMSDDTGVLLGVNRHNNSLCIVDLFDTRKNKNANLNLLGTSGAGKTFTLQLLALRMRMRGIQCYILAPIKGHEFRRACNRIGGQYIKIAPGSPHCINVMEIRHTVSPEMELIDGDSGEEDSMLARKIQQLMIFFSLLIPDMSNEDEQMLDEALIKTYADFGITHDNDSLYLDSRVTPPKMKKMPILGDLHKNLLENPPTKRVAIIVSRFVTGSAQSFNQQTNVDLSNKYIVLDLSELKGKLLPVGMMIALDYVWDNVKADRTKKKAIMIDEIWQLVGASSNRQAADFCLTIFKTIRGFGGAAISATQDLSDFFGLEDGKYGRAIINNSKNKIILNLEPDEARYVQEVLKLTKTETRSITRFERGEALVYSNNNKVPVVIKASREEQERTTTDRAELEAILRENSKMRTIPGMSNA